MNFLVYLAIGIIGYLIGSINTSIILSRLIYHEDIRKSGSGNAGMTNAGRVYGKKFAVMTAVGDLLKGVISILIGWFIVWIFTKEFPNEMAGVVTGCTCILGHVFPVYFGFKGGKGVLTSFAVMLMLAPIPALICLAGFAIVVVISRYVSLGSMVAAFMLPFMVFFFSGLKITPTFWFGIFLAILIIYCHRSNIKRIILGTESKLGKKKEDSDV